MIILSLGSNLSSKIGNRFDNLIYALKSLESFGILIIKKSSFYETPSYPDRKKPKFINIVISAKTDLKPLNLMSVLLDIEKKLGRSRTKKNEPRTCDIDIIDYNSEILNLDYQNTNLQIPHNQLTLRNFVLFPLEEILPNWKHPKTNEFVSALIKKLPDEDRKSILKIKKS